MISKIKDFVALFRVKQWVKNTFVFFPLLFSSRIFNSALLLSNLITFFGFCFIASGMYIFNDLLDIERDRLHPRKSQRPLARRDVNKSSIFILIVVILGIGLWTLSIVSWPVVGIAIFYIALHLLYNLSAKHVVLLDAFFVALGFQVRIWAGSLATEVAPSLWLQMCVFLLALFLGFTKRRYEISNLKDKAAEHRSVLAHYTTYLLDQIIIICSTLAIVFYGLYTISQEINDRLGNYYMPYTIVFVIYGIFRYLYLVHVKKLGDDPGEMLFYDKALLINVVLWIFSVFGIIYFSH